MTISYLLNHRICIHYLSEQIFSSLKYNFNDACILPHCNLYAWISQHNLGINTIGREAEMSVRGKHQGQRFEDQDPAMYA